MASPPFHRGSFFPFLSEKKPSDLVRPLGGRSAPEHPKRVRCRARRGNCRGGTARSALAPPVGPILCRCRVTHCPPSAGRAAIDRTYCRRWGLSRRAVEPARRAAGLPAGETAVSPQIQNRFPLQVPCKIIMGIGHQISMEMDWLLTVHWNKRECSTKWDFAIEPRNPCTCRASRYNQDRPTPTRSQTPAEIHHDP